MAAIDLFKMIGLQIIHGWNIVWIRMLPIVFIVISLSSQEPKIMVLMPSQLLGFVIGRMGTN
jgi:hypothetical protein